MRGVAWPRRAPLHRLPLGADGSRARPTLWTLNPYPFFRRVDIMPRLIARTPRSLRHLRIGVGALLALWCGQAGAADAPAWLDQKLLEAAKPEGTLVIYSAINEQEGLPTWQLIEQATGLNVEYIRGSEAQMVSRILIESRGDKPAWAILSSTAVHKMPQQ